MYGPPTSPQEGGETPGASTYPEPPTSLLSPPPVPPAISDISETGEAVMTAHETPEWYDHRMVFSQISGGALPVGSVAVSKPPPKPARHKGEVFVLFPKTIPFKERQQDCTMGSSVAVIHTRPATGSSSVTLLGASFSAGGTSFHATKAQNGLATGSVSVSLFGACFGAGWTVQNRPSTGADVWRCTVCCEGAKHIVYLLCVGDVACSFVWCCWRERKGVVLGNDMRVDRVGVGDVLVV